MGHHVSFLGLKEQLLITTVIHLFYVCLYTQLITQRHIVKEVIYKHFIYNLHNLKLYPSLWDIHCIVGRYVWGRVNIDGDPFFGQIKIDRIDLNKPGLFEMTFHAMIFCDGSTAVCNAAGDSISVIVDEESSSPINYVISYDNIGIQRIWQKKSFVFATYYDSEISVTYK